MLAPGLPVCLDLCEDVFELRLLFCVRHLVFALISGFPEGHL